MDAAHGHFTHPRYTATDGRPKQRAGAHAGRVKIVEELAGRGGGHRSETEALDEQQLSGVGTWTGGLFGGAAHDAVDIMADY